VILADEPTGALDSKSGETVMQILTALHKEGHTIIIVTHDAHIAEFADRIIEIKDGRILSDKRKAERVFERKKEQFKTKNSFIFCKDQLIESFKMSISAIFSHKLRSILTMLGIIIGIASVICVVALGKGSEEKILSEIRKIGTNTIDIYPGKNFGDVRAGFVSTLTISDSKVLARQPYVDYTTPNASASGTATYANLSSKAQLRGGGVNSLAVNGIDIEDGRNFSDDDIKNSASVAIIDPNTKKTFFKNSDPIGKTILFSGKPLKIIGISGKDENAFGSNENLRIYAPYSTVMNKITGNRKISSITIKIKDDVNTQVAEESLTQLLIQRHGSRDFHTMNADTIKQTIQSTTGTMTILISSIAELKAGTSLSPLALWGFASSTSDTYFYQFTSFRFSGRNDTIVILTRVDKFNKRDRHGMDYVNYLVVILLCFAVLVLIIIAKISGDIFTSITILEQRTQKIADGDLSVPITDDAKQSKAKSNEIISLTENLEKMRSALLDAHERRTRFIMGISHDLRTPVAVIKGYTEAISDDVITDKNEIKKSLEIIATKTNRLESMIDTLINFVKLDSADWRQKLVPESVFTVVSEFVKSAEMTGAVFKRKIKSAIALSPECKVPMDRQLFSRALENLLSNAIRYSKEGDTIAISATETDDACIVSVSDTSSEMPMATASVTANS